MSLLVSGWGEYIVYNQGKAGPAPIEKKVFDKVFAVFNEYLPENVKNWYVNTHSRYELILDKVKKIDPSLELAFIPRTLYELTLVRLGLQEQMHEGCYCPLVSAYQPTTCTEATPRKNCWHIVGELKGTEVLIEENAKVVEVAFKLNNLFIERLSSLDAPHTYAKMTMLLDEEIEFFQQFYKEAPAKEWKNPPQHHEQSVFLFGGSGSRGYQFPGFYISNSEDAKIYQIALKLECSEMAKEALLFYRGSSYYKDGLIDSDKQIRTLSYGTGLLAGCIFDQTATALCWMRLNCNDAFVTFVPFSEYSDSPFFAKSTQVIRQLYSKGELFHGRTKLTQDTSPNPQGIYPSATVLDLSHLKSDKNLKQLEKLFKKYHANAAFLKECSTKAKFRSVTSKIFN